MLFSLLGTLGYIHDYGLQHGDIHPGNIIIREGDGRPVLINFGMARRDIGLAVNAGFGTPGYTPCELLSSRGNAGPWSDIYALGAVFYRLITGMPPVPSRDRELNPALHTPLGRRDGLVARYGKTFIESVDSAMEMDATRRWQSTVAWLAALSADPVFMELFFSGRKPREEKAAPITPTRAGRAELNNQSEAGKTQEVGILLDCGAEVIALDRDGRTPQDIRCQRMSR